MTREARQTVPFEDVLHALQHVRRTRITLEARKRRYMFGALNYGEVPTMINDADGDCWDIILPGMTRRLMVNRPYAVKRVIGAVTLENGNHKIAVELFVPGFDHRKVDADVQRYMVNYTQFTRVDTEWRLLRELLADAAGS